MFEIDHDKFKEVRKGTNLSQAAFAEAIGTTEKDVSHYETGRAKPRADPLLTLLITFKIDPADIAKKV